MSAAGNEQPPDRELPRDLRRLVDLAEVSIEEAHRLLARRETVQSEAAAVSGFIHGYMVASKLTCSPFREDVLTELDPLERIVFEEIENRLGWTPVDEPELLENPPDSADVPSLEPGPDTYSTDRSNRVVRIVLACSRFLRRPPAPDEARSPTLQHGD